MTATRAETIAYAREFLGVAESPPRSNNVLFSRWYGLQGSWCAMFVSYVLYHVGNPLPISTPKGFAYCPAGAAWAQQHGRWHDASWSGAQAGDLIFYYFGGDHSPSHVGLVIDRLSDGRWHTVEGNTGSSDRDGGSVQERYRRTGIVGFAHLDYPTAKPPDEEVRYKPFPGHILRVGSTGPDVATMKLYLVLSGVAPELALQTPQQFATFGPQTTDAAVKKFKRDWNALTHQRRGDKLFLDPSTPAVGPVTWQCLVFSVAQRAAITA